ncbi:MAG: hypothetical protein JRF37_09430, partial [Deltaproteobacteria bacterium]|nr:hypothetical protein [Deltaproteobacteria bacterium]
MKSQSLKLVFFFLIGFLIYSNTFDVPFFFDDQPNVRYNSNIQLSELTFKGLWNAAFESPASNRPVSNISFAINYYFHQYGRAGYHIINTVIHILTAVFFYLLIETTLRLPTSTPSLHHSKTPPLETGSSTLPHHCVTPSTIALSAAILWLVHPVQTQSVTYIVQRMTAMAAMFYILSLLLYVKGRLAIKSNRNGLWYFTGGLSAAMLAIGSKEIAATLPIFVLLYEWYFFQDLSTAWLKRRLPYIAAALVGFGLIAFLFLGANPLHSLLAGYAKRDFTLIQRVLTEFRVIIYYIGLLFYPHPLRLSLERDFALSHSLIEPPTTLVCIAVVSGLIALAVILARRQRLISFSILWFFGNLAIESTIIPLEIIFEHRLYLPSMFFFAAITILGYRHIRKRAAVITLVCATTLLCGLWTYKRNSLWKNPI